MKRQMIEGETYRPYQLCVASLVPEWLESIETLKPGPKLCYARLARYQGKEGHSFPTLKHLAASLGTNERQAQRWVAELKKQKLIAVKQRGLAQSNVYTFLVHPSMSGATTIKGDTIEVTPRVEPPRQSSPTSEDNPDVPVDDDTGSLRESVEENQGRESKERESSEGESEECFSLKENGSVVLSELQRDQQSSSPAFPEVFKAISGSNTRRSPVRDRSIETELRTLLERLGISSSAYSKVEWIMLLSEMVDHQSNLLAVIEQVLALNGIKSCHTEAKVAK